MVTHVRSVSGNNMSTLSENSAKTNAGERGVSTGERRGVSPGESEIVVTDSVSPLPCHKFKMHPIKTLIRKNTPATLPKLEKLTGSYCSINSPVS